MNEGKRLVFGLLIFTKTHGITEPPHISQSSTRIAPSQQLACMSRIGSRVKKKNQQ